MTDAELVQRYAADNSEASFQAIVSRYLPLVYSAAVRQVRNPAMAEDVAQVVFIVLARKAAHLSSGTVLPAWLFRTTRHVASRALRTEIRRQKREQEALHMQTTETNDLWEQITPHLDEAMNHLGDIDRGAVILHFFENKRLREVGAALGMTEDTAQKRVSRAVEKLRKLLFKRGVVLPAVALPGLLMTRAVSAAPAQLTTNVTTVGLNQAGLPTSVYALLEQATPWAGLPSAKAIAIATVTILIVGGGAAAFWPKTAPRPPTSVGPSKYELQARAVAAKLAENQAKAPQVVPVSLPSVPPQPTAITAQQNTPMTIFSPAKSLVQATQTYRVPTPAALPPPPPPVVPLQDPAAVNPTNYNLPPQNFNNQPPYQPYYNGNGAPAGAPSNPNVKSDAPSRPTMSPLQRQPRQPQQPRSNLIKKGS
jgi:RNA polymerase sigma factor (sigma-70 family)